MVFEPINLDAIVLKYLLTYLLPASESIARKDVLESLDLQVDE